MNVNLILLISTLNTKNPYLDPGSGSLFIQLLIASLAGMGFYFLSKLEKIKKYFRKNSSENAEDDIDADVFDE